MRKILIVVDYQKDFVIGNMGSKYAEALEEPIYNKIQEYRANGDLVGFIRDTHDENYLNTREGRLIPYPHCLPDTEGWQLYGKVKDCLKEDDPKFYKKAFGSIDLALYLKAHEEEIDAVELCGIAAHGCVFNNVILAHSALPEAEIIVDAECVASVHEKSKFFALDWLCGMGCTVLNYECQNLLSYN